MEKTKNREQDYQSFVSKLENQFAQQQRSYSEAYLNQQVDFMNQISSLEHGMRQDANQLLRDQRAMYERGIAAMEHEFSAAVSDLEEELASIQNDHQEKAHYALTALENLEKTLAWVSDEYPWDRFLPDAIYDLEEAITQANWNYDQGFFDAVILQCQQIEQSLLRARREIERLEDEWYTLRDLLRYSAQDLFEKARSCRTVYPIDLQGRVMEEQAPIHVNYWSNGKLADFQERSRALIEEASDDDCDLSIEVMQDWIQDQQPAMEDELVEIVMTARVNVLNAQLRANIASIITETMKQQGFVIESSQNTSNQIDKRFEVNMVNLAGDEVTISVDPIQNAVGENEIHIDSHDKESRTYYEINQRHAQVAESLQEHGLNIEMDGLKEIRTGHKQAQERPWRKLPVNRHKDRRDVRQN
ncbi:MAG: hypothetical protein JW750_11105 [Anaerolineaceae bacterium]|nr:hypothetical protein [Anaerolineaceae bacterium]